MFNIKKEKNLTKKYFAVGKKGLVYQFVQQVKPGHEDAESYKTLKINCTGIESSGYCYVACAGYFKLHDTDRPFEYELPGLKIKAPRSDFEDIINFLRGRKHVKEISGKEAEAQFIEQLKKHKEKTGRGASRA